MDILLAMYALVKARQQGLEYGTLPPCWVSIAKPYYRAFTRES